MAFKGAAAMAVLQGHGKGFGRAQQPKGTAQNGNAPDKAVEPQGPVHTHGNDQGKRHQGKTKNEDQEYGGPITIIMLGKREAAGPTAVHDSQKG